MNPIAPYASGRIRMAPTPKIAAKGPASWPAPEKPTDAIMVKSPPSSRPKIAYRTPRIFPTDSTPTCRMTIAPSLEVHLEPRPGTAPPGARDVHVLRAAVDDLLPV